jgi:ATP-dependent RNA helicase DDX24/MAK5
VGRISSLVFVWFATDTGLVDSVAPDLPELAIEPGFLPKLKERIQIAKEIEKAQHQVKKTNHDRNWLKEVAEAMDVDIDPDVM